MMVPVHGAPERSSQVPVIGTCVQSVGRLIAASPGSGWLRAYCTARCRPRDG
jgi:hypothetical protein